ncbi:hypothetical protein D3C81_1411360 [compost metagenome]
MHGVADVQVAFAVLAFEALAGVDVVAGDVAQRTGQARHAEGLEVVVVAHLPGALVGKGELVGRHFVAQRADVGEDAWERAVAVDTLVADVEGMGATLG